MPPKGRPLHRVWGSGFQRIKDTTNSNKYNALCMVCNTIVKNKSYYGMLSHRNVCIFYSTSAKPSTPSNQLTEDTTMIQEEVDVDPSIFTDVHMSETICNEKDMGFYQIKDKKTDTQYKTYCAICSKTFRNSSIDGMVSHRNICSLPHGVFLVLKTDMNKNDNPSIWKINGIDSVQKYIPLEEDGNIWYTDTTIYNKWLNKKNNRYCYAPVSTIWHKHKIYLRFNKNKVQK